jgi:hypothetical protein
MRRVALALALLAALSTAASGAAPDCRALGFTGFSLCSSCDALESAVHDAGAPYSSPACAAADDAGRARAELAAECRQCCAADDSDGADAGPFDSAVLEVCPWRISMNSELREVATEAETQYGKRFKVKTRSGSPPTLVFSSKGGTPLRTRIDAWKRNAIMVCARVAAIAARAHLRTHACCRTTWPRAWLRPLH